MDGFGTRTESSESEVTLELRAGLRVEASAVIAHAEYEGGIVGLQGDFDVLCRGVFHGIGDGFLGDAQEVVLDL
jgi:hypothetical protein